MAGTWLDLPRVGRVSQMARRGASERKTDGGRHWARTSDLLHVKQVRGRIGAGLTVAKGVRLVFVRSDGWTLAGRLDTWTPRRKRG